MTETRRWQSIEPIEADRMSEARRQAHNALHWMARLANTYIEPRDDNAHVELIWDDDARALRTRPFGPGLNVELRIGSLELQFCERGKPAPHTLSLEERTPANVEAWVLVELLHRGMDRDAFSKELPYPAKDLMLGDHEEHEAEAYREELSVIDGWIVNAAVVLDAIRNELAQSSKVEADSLAIVCWPQSFQIGLEIDLPNGSGAPALRAGLSAGDALRAEPFFFVGTKDQALTGDFDPAAILSVQSITQQKLTADNVIAFLREQIDRQGMRLAG